MFFEKILLLRNSLLFRLTFLYTITFTLLSGLGFSTIYYRIYSVTIENMTLEMVAEADAYAEVLAEQGAEGLQKKVMDSAETEDPAEEFFRLVDDTATVIFSSDGGVWGEPEIQEQIDALRDGSFEYIAQIHRLPETGQKARVVTIEVDGMGFLQLGETVDETLDYLDTFRNLLMLLVSILIVTSAVIGWLLARAALKDVAAVTSTAEDIAAGNYEQRVNTRGRFDETRRLALAFNTMLDRIQELLRTMQQMTDNIAHDLRSPLARIRGGAEMIVYKEGADPDLIEMAGSTIEECDTLLETINTMLDITEAEAGVTPPKTESFDLADLVEKACELFRPAAEMEDILLFMKHPGSVSFQGDRKRMQRIITNLIENALKYTGVGGKVAVSVAAESGGIRIQVSDNGQGIAPDELPHIFNRFYRCEKSRSQSGVGLGLCLVKAYTESLGGTVEVSSRLNEGTTFSLSF